MSDFSWFFAAQQPSSTASESLITPLFTAASRGDADSLRAAIADESEDLSVNGWCSYHVAAAKGHVECLQILKEMRYPLPSALLVPTPSGLNALHLAAKNAQVPACAFLIESSGDEAVESICSDGHTSLTLSCHSGHIEVVRFLVGAGANPATASSEGMTPLLVAATAGHLEILELLSDLKPEGRNLLCAVSLGGHTVLHKASGAGHTKVVDYLLKRRQEILLAESVVEGGGSRSAGVNDPRLSFADVDVLSLTGASSLHMAAQGGYLGAVSLLVAAGAKVDLPSHVGQTSLHKAAFEGHYDVIDFLLTDGHANARLLDHKGYSVLMCAASGGRHRIVDRLLDRNCSSSPAASGAGDLGRDMAYVGMTLRSGEDAAVLASTNGFQDLSSKLTRRLYLGMRRNSLLKAAAKPSVGP